MNSLRKKYKFEISPQTVDFNYQITLASLTDLLLTTAGYNAEENGFGMRKLNEQGLSWVLLRLAIEIEKRPFQYENIEIETWIESVNRVSTNRNFCIRNNEGRVIGYATSTWAMIDNVSRRAQDLFTLDNIRAFESQQTVPIEKPKKLDSCSGEQIDQFKTKYSHIDINRHVNTMRYIEWVSNYFSLEHYETKKIKRADFNFMSEILFGDEVTIHFLNGVDNTYQFEIFHNGKTSCRAKLVFEEK